MKKFIISIMILIVVVFGVGLSACVTDKLEQKPSSYIVTFKDYDGSIIEKQTVEAGKDATPPKTPIRKGYEFDKWDKEVKTINADIIVTAEYKIVKNQIYVEYTENENVIEALIGFYGDVKICGFEAVITFNTSNLEYNRIEKLQVEGIKDINFTKVNENSVKIFFYQDDIENITNSFNFLTFYFDLKEANYSIDFDINVEVAVDSELETVEFSKANLSYR